MLMLVLVLVLVLRLLVTFSVPTAAAAEGRQVLIPSPSSILSSSIVPVVIVVLPLIHPVMATSISVVVPQTATTPTAAAVVALLDVENGEDKTARETLCGWSYTLC